MALRNYPPVSERTIELAMTSQTIEARFARFHGAHPEVYDQLVKLARDLHAAGHTRCSIVMLYEVVRWEGYLRGPTDEPYKLNNDFRSRYARLIMANEPDLARFFEVRELTAE